MTRATSCSSSSTISPSSILYHERIKAFHVKDAEFRPSGRSGVYGGYQDWIDRPGRFRSLGDGQIDFRTIFSKLAQYDYSGLGGARMGMLSEASRGWRARGRRVHRRPHHPRDRSGVRRLCRRRGQGLSDRRSKLDPQRQNDNVIK